MFSFDLWLWCRTFGQIPPRHTLEQLGRASLWLHFLGKMVTFQKLVPKGEKNPPIWAALFFLLHVVHAKVDSWHFWKRLAFKNSSMLCAAFQAELMLFWQLGLEAKCWMPLFRFLFILLWSHTRSWFGQKIDRFRGRGFFCVPFKYFWRREGGN